MCVCDFLFCFSLEQMLYYNTGLIPSQYIEVMLDKDKSAFNQILVTSIILTTATALVIPDLLYI